MTMHEPQRVRFHNWLVEHDLDEDVADAILATMPPYDWHELATKDDLTRVEQGLRSDFAGLRSEFGGLRSEFEGLRSEFEGLRSEFGGVRGEIGGLRSEIGDLRTDVTKQLTGLRQEIRLVLFALVGFMLSLILAVTSGGLG